MILNTNELYSRLFEQTDETRSLCVIPPPDRDKFKANSGASIDLRLGRWFRTMKQSNLHVIKLAKTADDQTDIDQSFTKEHFVRFDDEFILHPGKFVLGITLEWIVVPGDLAGHVTGKSSLGRRGLIIETAAGVQPGFSGCLTLELANVGEIPIALRPGISVCQVFFHQSTSFNQAARSQFKGARKPLVGSVR